MELQATLNIIGLREAGDFKGFKVTARAVEHVWVSRAELERLAGTLAEDPGWQAELEGMLAYAESKGWTNESGEIRAHVEWT